MQKRIDTLEHEVASENTKLDKINKTINVADERLDETEYGVRRRRGTLITLQKMSDKRLQRFGFDQTKLIHIEKEEEKEPNENHNKQISFAEILKKSGSKQMKKVDAEEKKFEKAKLDFQRRLIMFRRNVRGVENHCKDTENKILLQKSKVKQLVEACQMEVSTIGRISSEMEKLNIG